MDLSQLEEGASTPESYSNCRGEIQSTRTKSSWAMLDLELSTAKRLWRKTTPSMVCHCSTLLSRNKTWHTTKTTRKKQNTLFPLFGKRLFRSTTPRHLSARSRIKISSAV